MEKTPLTTQQVIDLIEAIPADKFCIGNYCNNNGCCCVMGHINTAIGEMPSASSIENGGRGYIPNEEITSPANIPNLGLRYRSKAYLMSNNIPLTDITSINNYPTSGYYTQYEPKDRVLALLKDMLAAGY